MTKKIYKKAVVAALGLIASNSTSLLSQATGTVTETINQRYTIGTLTASPTANVVVGQAVQFNYILQTGGAPAPTAETVQFFDGSTQIGTPQQITLTAASNLIPYAQVDTVNGWTVTGVAPTITVNAITGADGSPLSATTIAFPDTTTGSSRVSFSVPSTVSYAGQTITFSVWAQSATPTAIQLNVTDSPQVGASQTNNCAVTSTWQRCFVSYAFPAGSGTGFAVNIISSANPAQTVNVWGAQVEQAAQPGPFVSTIGTAIPTGAQAGAVTFSYDQFLAGVHPITVQYQGDANFVASDSNVLNLTVGKGASSITLTDSPAGTSIYGAAVTFTAQVSGPDTTPTGSVEFFDGSQSLGTVPLNGTGKATLTTVGLTSLSAGTHDIFAVYSGDANFNTSTSNDITHTVTKVSGTVTVALSSSLNPAIFGDAVTFKVIVSSSVGVIPTGTVAVTDGSTSLGVITLDPSGKGSVLVPTFTAGAHTIVATYSGDSNYQ